MGFNRDVIRRRRDQLHAWGVRMRGPSPPTLGLGHQGARDRPGADQAQHRLTLYFCVNYGGRAEIGDAARAIAQDVSRGRLTRRRPWTSARLPATFLSRACQMGSLRPVLGRATTSNFCSGRAPMREMSSRTGSGRLRPPRSGPRSRSTSTANAAWVAPSTCREQKITNSEVRESAASWSAGGQVPEDLGRCDRSVKTLVRRADPGRPRLEGRRHRDLGLCDAVAADQVMMVLGRRTRDRALQSSSARRTRRSRLGGHAMACRLR